MISIFCQTAVFLRSRMNLQIQTGIFSFLPFTVLLLFMKAKESVFEVDN